MDRRELAKKSAVGLCGLAIPSSVDAKSAGVDPAEIGGMGCVCFPDKVVSIIQYQDKIIVACEYSIWEMWQDHTGQFVKSLISQF